MTTQAEYIDGRVIELVVYGNTLRDQAEATAAAEWTHIEKQRVRGAQRRRLLRQAQRLQAHADAQVEPLRGIVVGVVRDARATADTSTIAAAIRTGNTMAVLGALPRFPTHVGKAAIEFDPLANALHSVFSSGAGETGFNLVPSFGVIDAHAVEYARAQSTRWLTGLTHDQADVVRSVIARASSGQYTVDQAARMLRDTVGLPNAGANAVINYRDALEHRLDNGLSLADAAHDEAIGRALATSTLRGATSVDELTQAYADRWVAYNALSVARTETMAAANAGLVEGWQAAVDAQLLDGDSPVVWFTAEDGDVCDECDGLDGEQIGTVNDPGTEQPPLHPNCRCVVSVDAAMPGELSAAPAAEPAASDEPMAVGDLVPNYELTSMDDIDRAAVDWQYMQESTESRYAAERMLGIDHPGSAPEGRQWLLDALDRGSSAGLDASQAEGVQSAVDRAYTLLEGIWQGEMQAEGTLSKGLSLYPDTPGADALLNLHAGDLFDISLSSFSESPAFAEDWAGSNYLHAAEAPRAVLFEIEPGASFVGTESTLDVINSAGDEGFLDAITSGRFEVVNIENRLVGSAPQVDARVIRLRQVGVFDPAAGGTVVAKGAAYAQPPFSGVLDAGPGARKPKRRRSAARGARTR